MSADMPLLNTMHNIEMRLLAEQSHLAQKEWEKAKKKVEQGDCPYQSREDLNYWLSEVERIHNKIREKLNENKNTEIS